MTTYQLSCTVGTTDPSAKLGFELWIDDQQLYAVDQVTTTTPISFDFEEDEAEHELRFILKNKTSADTRIDDAGNILSDARLTVSDIMFDEIALGQIFIDNAEYTHDFNGTQDKSVNKFYGEIGCNGVVSLKFSTPVYLWLLEHM
jgi:hypothetical protein